MEDTSIFKKRGQNIWHLFQKVLDKYFVPISLERPAPYLVAILGVGLALFLSVHFRSLSVSTDLLLLVSVVFSSWYGGLGPGLLAWTLSSFALLYFYPDLYEQKKQYEFLSLAIYVSVGLVVCLLVAALKRSGVLIANMALEDHLTGLPNRRAFEEKIEAVISITERDQSKLALVLLDIDNFKQINDRLGHHNGDEVLKKTTQVLRSIIRDEDIISRWGGDEFVILFPGIKTIADVEVIIAKIAESFQAPLLIEDQPQSITVSIGISVFPTMATNKAALFKTADEALYEAKRAGKNSYKIYEPGPKVLK